MIAPDKELPRGQATDSGGLLKGDSPVAKKPHTHQESAPFNRFAPLAPQSFFAPASSPPSGMNSHLCISFILLPPPSLFMKEIAHKGRVAQNHAIHGGNGRRAGYEVVITWGTETRRPAAGMALLFNPYMAADTSRPPRASRTLQVGD